MALEGGDDGFGALVEAAVDVDAVAVEGEHGLQRFHRLAGIAALKEAAAADFLRLDEMADAGGGEKRPGKALAGIELSPGRHVGMAEHAVGLYWMAPQNVAAEGAQRLDLRGGEIGEAAGMAGIGELDADGAGIDVGVAGPGGRAGVPGAALLRHERQDAAVRMDEIMRRHLARRVAQPGERLIVIGHAGVVQEQHVRRAALPRAVIGRGAVLDGDAPDHESRLEGKDGTDVTGAGDHVIAGGPMWRESRRRAHRVGHQQPIALGGSQA
jgi:hypothetical protein